MPFKLTKIILLFLFITSSVRAQGIKKDIPTNKDGTPGSYYEGLSLIKQQLGLDKLEDGSDGISIRVWYQGLSNFREMYELKKSKGRCSVTYYGFLIETDSNYESMITKKIFKIITPRNTCATILDSLLNMGIDTLPDMNNIPGFVEELSDVVVDGVVYSFEISTKDKYRFYSYYAPSRLLKFTQIKQCIAIINTLEYEFDRTNRRKEIIKLLR